MSEISSIVRKLQSDAISQDVSVSSLLRTAKLIATKLDQKEALVWIDRELNGYLNVSVGDLPSYRQLLGTPHAYNPFQGWLPIIVRKPEVAERLATAHIGMPLVAIEKEARDRGNGSWSMPYPPELAARVRDAINENTDVRISLSYGQVWNIIESVRNLILNWSLELERAGILGENIVFTEQDKREATRVTHQFIIQNVGVLGDVSGQAIVSNVQHSGTLNFSAVRDFSRQAHNAIALLPVPKREEFQSLLTEIDDEASKEEPNASRLKSLLLSAKAITEGAIGNLAAQGITQLITSLLK
jgi:hypothetical protein